MWQCLLNCAFDVVLRISIRNSFENTDPYLPDIAQKCFCTWHEHTELNFQINQKWIDQVPYRMSNKTNMESFTNPPFFFGHPVYIVNKEIRINS